MSRDWNPQIRHGIDSPSLAAAPGSTLVVFGSDTMPGHGATVKVASVQCMEPGQAGIRLMPLGWARPSGGRDRFEKVRTGL